MAEWFQFTNCSISKTLIHSIHDSPTVFFSPHLYSSVNTFQSFQLVTLVQNLINVEMSEFLENGGWYNRSRGIVQSPAFSYTFPSLHSKILSVLCLHSWQADRQWYWIQICSNSQLCFNYIVTVITDTTTRLKVTTIVSSNSRNKIAWKVLIHLLYPALFDIFYVVLHIIRTMCSH